MKSSPGAVGVLVGIGIWLSATIPPEGLAASTGPAKNKADLSAAFFADRAVRVFQIELSESAMDSLRRTPRQHVSGTVREGDKVFPKVAIHIKGMGSFQPLDEKPSFVIKFNEFSPELEYYGMTKLMLNNSVQDQTYVSELLATGLFRDAGVPAARVTHARVILNGRDVGLHVAIEAMNKRFLKRHFKHDTGNLYDGYLQDINIRLHQGNGDDTSQSDLRRLWEVCRTIDPASRFERLHQVLDVDRFVSFAAMEVLINHWDGYTLKANNYRAYHDPVSGKIVFIPYGMDSVFRRLNIPIRPPMQSIVSRALFSTSQGRALYEQRFGYLFTNVMRFSAITNRMEEALAKLRAAAIPGFEYTEVERQAATMRTRIAFRLDRIAGELAGHPPVPLAFDAAGLARPEGWRDEFDRGSPVLDRVTVQGKTALHIQARNGRTRGSWRTMIHLAPGRYRFEGLLRTDGVANGYADLRISGDTRSLRLAGTNPWQRLTHDFALEEGGDAELVCELTALEGEVWFDLVSLQVRKL